jgi:steroid delta-isomerase-like uncharacterized protein
MSVEQNKAVVRRLFEEAVNQRNIAVLDELLADDIAIHTPVPGVEPGLEGFKRFLGIFLDAFPQQSAEIHQMVAEGDRVAVLHTHHVVHGGELMGLPPTGKEAHVQGIEIFRLRDGKIAEFWHQDDFLGLMQQLGVIPAPGQ